MSKRKAGMGYVPSAFPKTYRERQGERVKDRWGPCRECGYPGGFQCRRCKSWRCGACIRFRKARGAEPGVYHAVCDPKCRNRMNPAVAERVRELVRRREEDLNQPWSPIPNRAQGRTP